ncbi:uncharacterized protein LOC110855956 [Folsomia candida]|uniref:Uncharacterized protein n=1 Tax=Folsomia candida TaxID=158441 RepID=A0A226DQA9_FOLCA|nr:uncharacterized protein LOC110855956 [Folsomia candida]OXA46861.1 hypothetical protein Fcan01_18261 [Folsomia candida]
MRSKSWSSFIYVTLSFLILQMTGYSTSGESASKNINTNQLNCTKIPGICPEICGEKATVMSATFCEPQTGSCVCDCRDVLEKSCTFTPFTPCFQDCVRKNPNPSVFLYEGANCPTTKGGGGQLCACQCSLREDYIETNDI